MRNPQAPTLGAIVLLLVLAMVPGCGPGRKGGSGGGGLLGGGGDGEQGGGDQGAGVGGDQGGGGAGGQGGGDGEGGEDDGSDGGAPTDTFSIIRLQDDSLGGRPADGTRVSLTGVVSAGPNARGSFHVQDSAARGPWTGIFIYNPGAPGDDRHVAVEGVAVGKTVQVVGEIVEFARTSDQTGGTVTEIRLASVTAGDDAVSPEPAEVDADTVASGAGAEQWEGVLVSVGAVEVTEINLDGGLFAVTGGLHIGHLYYDHTAAVDQTMTHLIGVLSYDYGTFRLDPRSADDVGAQRADLPVITPSDLQNPAGQPDQYDGARIAMEGVVVTGGPSGDGQFLFVESPEGGAYSGVSVYNNGGAVDLEGVRVGVAVDIEGRYQEFKLNDNPNPATVTQLALSAITFNGPAEVSPAPEAVTVAELTAGEGAEPWEGVLVVVSDVTVRTVDVEDGYFTLEGGLQVDDLLHGIAVTPGSSFVSLTGVLHFVVGRYVLLPRSDADGVTD